jgi:hypothetical protein
MNNNHVVWFIVESIFLTSCTNPEKMPEKKSADTTTEFRASTTDAATVKKQIAEIDTANYDYKYIFANDSINRALYIKKGPISKRYQVPEKLKFKLILHDKLGKLPDKRFEGLAVLASSNESFSEKNDINEGDYFAADYVYSIKDCNLKIRLDIEGYMVCAVSTTCIDIKEFFKSYPDYDIMKRGNYQK